MIRKLTAFQPKVLLLFIGFSLSVGIASSAWADPTFGAEFNFTNSDVVKAQNGNYVNSKESEAARDRFMAAVKKACGDCTIENKSNHYGVKTYHISYPDGWHFDIATDPAVVEVQMKPVDAKWIRENEGRIQSQIFDTAKEAGLLPATQVMSNTWAGSHIHVGAESALGTGPEAVKTLKDFMADFSNHSELASGIFSYDTLNAAALALLPEAEQLHFKEISAEVDAGKITTIEDFAQKIRAQVYDVSYSGKVSPTTKYQAFNVNRIGDAEFGPDSSTFELRAMRGQESAHDFMILTTLINARIAYVKSLHAPVAIQLKAQMTTEEKVNAFYRYVVETGLDFEPYEKLLNSLQIKYLPAAKASMADKMCRLLLL